MSAMSSSRTRSSSTRTTGRTTLRVRGRVAEQWGLPDRLGVLLQRGARGSARARGSPSKRRGFAGLTGNGSAGLPRLHELVLL